jgi:hypothetical protein
VQIRATRVIQQPDGVPELGLRHGGHIHREVEMPPTDALNFWRRAGNGMLVRYAFYAFERLSPSKPVFKPVLVAGLWGKHPMALVKHSGA